MRTPRVRTAPGRPIAVAGARISAAVRDAPGSLGPGQHHDAKFGHVLDRPAEAFAAEPRVLHAAVWHVVDPVGRDVVDDDAADLQLAERRPGRSKVVRE